MVAQRTKLSFFSHVGLHLAEKILAGIGTLEGWLHRRIAYRHVLHPCNADVYLAAWTGTGAEVVMMMLHQLKTDRFLEFPHIEAVVPPFEFALYLGHCHALAAQLPPRLFRTYGHPSNLPREGRFIFLLRRPEDVVEASVRSHLLISGGEDRREQIIDRILSDHINYGSWLEYTRAWWARRKKENVLVLRFEEVLEDLSGTARRVAKHCGLSVDSEHIARAAAFSHPDFLAKHPGLFDPRIHWVSSSPAAPFIRRGKVGDGQELFSGKHRSRIEKRLNLLEHRLKGVEETKFRRLVAAHS